MDFLFEDVDDFVNSSCLESILSMPSELTDNFHSSYDALLPNSSYTQVLCTDGMIETAEEAKARREEQASRRRKQRQKAKDERSALKRKVNDLTDHLNQLKSLRESRGQLQTNDLGSFWGNVANRQRAERQRLEAEQRRLIQAAKVQASYIDHLRSLIHCSGNVTEITYTSRQDYNPSYAILPVETAFFFERRTTTAPVPTIWYRSNATRQKWQFGKWPSCITARTTVRR
ncbi:hypothetical protein GN244_ATG06153 [Phytophthora infestans]|uniref:Uncharacterized protein n=1 Tax=Phytophthora infestans TaxID=4787 RepID=A0A833SY11_PHYIN|nr:hypothetical protein GN244_ATG06153 [Phytophthora infestans]KAF4133649.1 hypothetical protein GN958_ATG16986 [Phytophthora infestans]